LIISRRASGLADARVSSNRVPGTGTMSRAAISFLLRLELSNSKDHEVAVSSHADTPRTGHDSHVRIRYPIHHSRGRERRAIRSRVKADAGDLKAGGSELRGP
jgi:hypothetical protein